MLTHKDGALPPFDKEWLFVFGSNEAGIHGAGAAKVARDKYMARLGFYDGKINKAYAIPTKDYHIKTLPLDRIKVYVDKFIDFTHTESKHKFWLTRVGCGLAGYKDFEIAPLFKGVNLENTSVPEEWKEYFENAK